MRKTHMEEIRGHKVECFLMDGERGVVILTKLVKLLSPSLSEIMGSKGLQGMLDKKINELSLADLAGNLSLGTAIEKLGGNLDVPEVKTIMQDLLSCLSIDGQRVELKSPCFAGKYGLMFESVYYAAKCNFSDFFLEQISTEAHTQNNGRKNGDVPKVELRSQTT